MKKGMESMMIVILGLLIVLIAGLIVRYNMINDEIDYEVDPALLQSQKGVKKPTTTDYLKTLEGYKEGDVEVKKQKDDSSVNIVEVKTEATEEDIASEIDSAIDTAKKIDSYVDNLEHYDESAKHKAGAAPVTETQETQTIQQGADPMSDIVNDIDSIVESAGE